MTSLIHRLNRPATLKALAAVMAGIAYGYLVAVVFAVPELLS